MEVMYNWWAIAGGTAVSIVIGMLWYSPSLFGEAWMKAAKLSKKDTQENQTKPMIVAMVRAFLVAFALYHIIYVTAAFYSESSWFTNSWQVGVWVGIIFGSLGIKMHDAFDKRPMILTKINAGFELASIVLAAVAIGLIGV